MADDEQQVRTLIERWAKAVHSGNIEEVLADHAGDIVMFDVPPPHDGVRGIEAYRETWPGFFEWQARGASFEIVSLNVTAGDEVAYAHALLRCGTQQELADHPDCGSRSVCARRMGDGWSRTSITRSRTPMPRRAPLRRDRELHAPEGSQVGRHLVTGADGKLDDRTRDQAVTCFKALPHRPQ
jgi:ketosteroid isomerase-like protein